MLSLELVKTRLAVMSMEMRKNFIQAILTSLIEKSPDAKILRSVVKIVEEWVKNNSPMAANQVSWAGAVLWPVGLLERRFSRRCRVYGWRKATQVDSSSSDLCQAQRQRRHFRSICTFVKNGPFLSSALFKYF